MQKNRIKERLGICCLVCVMLLLIIKSGMYMWTYYKGPMYSIDTYVKSLNERNYDKIYNLLDKSSLKGLDNAQVISQYYERFYAKDHTLVKVSKVGWIKDQYMLEYRFTTGVKKVPIRLIQNQEGWRILFPFEFSSIQIKAPNGARVSIGGITLEYEEGVGYRKDKLLPGKYMLEVELPDQREKNYYQMIEVSQDEEFVLPYTLGEVQVICAPCLEVHIGSLKKSDDMGIVSLKDILVGHYNIELVHPKGYIDTVSIPIEVVKGNQSIEVKDYTLSSKGDTKWQDFLKGFYADYEASINTHTTELLNPYFSSGKRAKQIQLFDSWYIADKNIVDTNISYKADKPVIDAEGRLHSLVIETVELKNKEYDQLKQEEVTRVYKVMIKWHTTVDISLENWKVIDRSIEESVVAFKDLEGKWVQY